jgi:hypothetical protein
MARPQCSKDAPAPANGTSTHWEHLISVVIVLAGSQRDKSLLPTSGTSRPSINAATQSRTLTLSTVSV